MKILADQYLYRLTEMIPDGVQLELYNPNDGLPAYASEFDALLIRTISKINPHTLPHAGNLKFIGTATAGFDHVDSAHLEKLGIEFARSVGCNANAVAEYVLTVLYHWAENSGSRLSNKKIGIAGMGNTGGRVAGYLKKLNISFAGFDPPKQERDPGFTSCSIEELLCCDILTFHTPLTLSGNRPTYHMCSDDWLGHGFDLVINAARGGIVDEKSLFRSKKNGLISDFILDVWENEPLFSDEIAGEAFIATPHIAGYSKEAKWLASKLVADQLCDFFSLEKPSKKFRLRPSENLIREGGESFARFLWDHHIIDYYDSELRKIAGMDHTEKRKRFSLLRSETDTRFEFASILKEMQNKGELPQQTTIFL